MGRRKGYEREKLVEKAKSIFHKLGYLGTSTEVLVQELGVNRNSLYLEFGSKESIFAASLDHYDQLEVTQIFGSLESEDATLDSVEALFRFFSQTADASTGIGCLMCNTAAELGDSGGELQPLVERYFTRLHSAFSNALNGAIRIGQVAIDTDITAEARFLTSSSLGIFLMVRAGASRTGAQGAIEGALNHLRLLRSK